MVAEGQITLCQRTNCQYLRTKTLVQNQIVGLCDRTKAPISSGKTVNHSHLKSNLDATNYWSFSTELSRYETGIGGSEGLAELYDTTLNPNWQSREAPITGLRAPIHRLAIGADPHQPHVAFFCVCECVLFKFLARVDWIADARVK